MWPGCGSAEFFSALYDTLDQDMQSFVCELVHLMYMYLLHAKFDILEKMIEKALGNHHY